MLPGHNNVNPFTSQRVLEKQREKKRQEAVSEWRPRGGMAREAGLRGIAGVRRTRALAKGCNVVTLTSNNQLGAYRCDVYRSLTRASHLAMLNPSTYVQASLATAAVDAFQGHTEIHDIACSAASKRLAVAYNRPLWFSHYDLSPDRWLRPTGGMRGREVAAWLSGMMLSRLQFLRLGERADEPSFVLYAWTCDKARGTTLTLRDFALNSVPEWRASVTKMRHLQSLVGVWRDRQPLVSAAWEAVMKLPVILYDVTSNAKQGIQALRGRSVHSQLFNENGNLLYSGLKDGRVFCVDTRELERPVCQLRYQGANVGVCCMRMQPDPNYILTGDYDGGILRWDVRMRKVMQEFHGHENDYHGLPFHVDDTANIVYAVGTDGFTRAWSLTTAQLLCTLPAPCPVQDAAHVPKVLFSTEWGGVSGCTGFLFSANVDKRPMAYLYPVRPAVFQL
ncbi:PREDICTED: DDB1- and CUL4-associated factor 4-like isoform X2 [Priapulus caudatus]|nr:PREDICTED: DDB1- and CUL4-associated factor 4-like isoform X2 [Priapulus caudatus]XP_014663937.1 PREDICTED: DDB1- and CUL4-associated factor 4-like isoform X2 [Priapulus caudatus]XP_014663945.1 PREDICTED: DDB1- and CUL4-associated factor 4-like isoform X2 [Priapulus caudatus]